MQTTTEPSDWDAVEALMQRLEHDNRSADVWCELGVLMHALREHEHALVAFDNALALLPDMEEARIGRAVVKASLELQVQTLSRRAVGDLWNAVITYGPGAGASGARRRHFTRRLSWGVPNLPAIEAITAFANGPILEVGAGRGLWAALLREGGAEVIATDPYAPDETFTDIAPLTVEAAVETHREATCLFLCWPLRELPIASTALAGFAGDGLAFVGELGATRVTGDDAFVAQLEAGWVEVRRVAIPRWPGFSDSLVLFRRRDQPK